MTPRMGRPKKGWTRSRTRQLVRLYTLTTLDNIELQKALEDDKFDPKERNIQTQLQSLFPKDYRGFRPKNDAQMNARLNSIRRINHGRITKSQRHKRSKNRAGTSRGSNSRQGHLENCAEAFRDDSDHSTPELTRQLSPSSSSDSFPTVSSRVMLDGSFITDILSEEHAIGHRARVSKSELSWFRLEDDSGRSPTFDDNSEQQPVIRDSRISREDASEPQVQSGPQRVLPPISECQSKDAPLKTGVQGLEKRLPRRSSSFVHRVYSVLSHSTNGTYRTSLSWNSNPTWRSSWMSLGSSGSKTSARSSVQKPFLWNEQDLWDEIVNESALLPVSDARPSYQKISVQNRPCCNLLVYCVQRPCTECGCSAVHSGAYMNDPWFMRSLELPEANTRDFFGNTALHYAASSYRPTLSSITRLIDRGADSYAKNTSGQTFMHVLNYHSLFGSGALLAYITLLKILQNLNFPFWHRDCHGRTVAHTFCSSVFRQRRVHDMALFGQILQILNTDLSSLDNHGYKAAGPLESWVENYSQSSAEPVSESKADLMQMLEDPLLPLDEEDSNASTESVDDACHLPDQTALDETRALLASLQNSKKNNISFRQLTASNNRETVKWLQWLRRARLVSEIIPNRKPVSSKDSETSEWLGWLHKNGLASWVDIHGDTPLIATLKKWRHEYDEVGLKEAVKELLIIGPDVVDMRDRRGHTALAVASIRGSESLVHLLLDAGANPNSRNYSGKGILVQASERMEFAKRKGDNRCYSKILTCINLLIDNGAKPNPTERDEWLLPEHNGKTGID